MKLWITSPSGKRHLIEADEYTIKGDLIYLYNTIPGSGVDPLDKQQVTAIHKFESLVFDNDEYENFESEPE